MAAKKQWSIPTVLRELRRVVDEVTGSDIMEVKEYKVSDMVNDLTTYHMDRQMEIPGQMVTQEDDDAS